MSQDKIKEEIRTFIKQTILQDDTASIEFDAPLISGSVIDSISTLKLVDFLEQTYNIEFQPHEVDRDNLDTIDMIANFVVSKQ